MRNRAQEWTAENPGPPDQIGNYGINGPGGTTTRVMWNEKSVLDRYVNECAVTGPGQSLPSRHDACKVGVYATNSVGDYD